jgi:PhnB protein
MTDSTETQPAAAEVKDGMIAHLQLDGAMKAAEFYRRALDAKLLHAVPVGDKGRTMHVHLHINGSWKR